jgi:protein phosphatase
MLPNDSAALLQYFLRRFRPMLRLQPEEIHWVGRRIAIPKFTTAQISSLIQTSLEVLHTVTSACIDLPFPAWIIGDIHGNFHDLLRTLLTIGPVGMVPIVFLGDYVDRGDYSLEVILLLLTLKCAYPDAVYLLRGNHEFSVTNGSYGFKQEIDNRFPGSDLWAEFNRVFSYLPLAAVLGDSYVLLHGGIGPTARTLQVIRAIKLPILGDDADGLISEIVWSDPNDSMTEYVQSQRGRGWLFGSLAVREFMKTSGCTRLIRAHQCVMLGVEAFAYNMGLTVFTSSNYTNEGNQAGFIYVEKDGKITTHRLDPIVDLCPLESARFEDEMAIMDRPVRSSQSFGMLSLGLCRQGRARQSLEINQTARLLTQMFHPHLGTRPSAPGPSVIGPLLSPLAAETPGSLRKLADLPPARTDTREECPGTHRSQS